VEVLDTPNAVATYNILVQEGRAVAAAMILPIDESET
jgi:NADH dehydrogenase [ubiquinone] 1 alpha subcomplex assembly factor 3